MTTCPTISAVQVKLALQGSDIEPYTSSMYATVVRTAVSGEGSILIVACTNGVDLRCTSLRDPHCQTKRHESLLKRAAKFSLTFPVQCGDLVDNVRIWPRLGLRLGLGLGQRPGPTEPKGEARGGPGVESGRGKGALENCRPPSNNCGG